jgi:hypothetical protein
VSPDKPPTGFVLALLPRLPVNVDRFFNVRAKGEPLVFRQFRQILKRNAQSSIALIRNGKSNLVRNSVFAKSQRDTFSREFNLVIRFENVAVPVPVHPVDFERHCEESTARPPTVNPVSPVNANPRVWRLS